jgi:hypothetical protein
MKQFVILSVCFLFIALASYRYHPGNLDISIKDADHYFYMAADFDKNKTRRLEHFMNREIGKESNFSFVNTRTNATVRLDDNTKFFLRKEPGLIRIKLNKDENSPAAYYRIKAMCEGMKDVMTR